MTRVSKRQLETICDTVLTDTGTTLVGCKPVTPKAAGWIAAVNRYGSARWVNLDYGTEQAARLKAGELVNSCRTPVGWGSITTAVRWVDRPLTQNRKHNMHWAQSGPVVAQWKLLGFAKLAQQLRRAANDGRRFPPCKLEWVFTYPGGNTPDPDNLGATTKPLLDGLVEAGLWPNDSSVFVRNGGVNVTVDRKLGDGSTMLTVTPLDPDEVLSIREPDPVAARSWDVV